MRRFTFKEKVNLKVGTNKISLLSIAVGLPHVGGHFESWNAGILGPVLLHGLDEGDRDLSWQKWTYQVGMKGESMNLAYPNGISIVEWMDSNVAVERQLPLMWHKAYFDAPKGNDPLALDMSRYWTAYAHRECNACSYGGTYRPPKCQDGCGQPTQRWYHVPRSWLKPTDNLLVVFEELGGDPTKISLVKRLVGTVCAQVSEDHPMLKDWDIESYGRVEELHRPKVHLHCTGNQYIVSIKFASFGTPLGTCGTFREGPCHSPASFSVLEKKCAGKQRCAVTISNSNFGEDPCPNVRKRLSVEAVCATQATHPTEYAN